MSVLSQYITYLVVWLSWHSNTHVLVWRHRLILGQPICSAKPPTHRRECDPGNTHGLYPDDLIIMSRTGTIAGAPTAVLDTVVTGVAGGYLLRV